MDDDFTLVVGVDQKHLGQLRLVFPTWSKHKPSILHRPMIVFYDHASLSRSDVLAAIKHPRLSLVAWPPEGVCYNGDPNNKWTHPQRAKMLAGFVHVPAMEVVTPYWLKLDTDVVATGRDDWIDKKWFVDHPAIIAQRWGYTKPADQMVKLDEWVKANYVACPLVANRPPLNLVPAAGADTIGHKRIISWCAFFSTEFTKYVSDICNSTCGRCQLPIPSQDGTMWYTATRLGLGVRRLNFKDKGFSWWSTESNIRRAACEALGNGNPDPN